MSPRCLLLLAAFASACGREEASVEPENNAEPRPAATRAPSDPGRPYDHVVLVTFDTLRADHLPSYGYTRDTAPFFAHLAQDGVLFENALASVSHTAPSHATMLTGLPPRVHGVRKNGNKLAERFPSLPTLLRARGFASGAFLGAQFLGGVARGFEHVSKLKPTPQEITDQAVAWARARGEQPYFLWLHLYEPHKWKRPPLPDWARQAVVQGQASSGGFYDYLARLHGLPLSTAGAPARIPWSGADGHGQRHARRSSEEVLGYIDDYDGLIRLADSEVQRLYESLEGQGALEGEGSSRKGLWILTSDHGEGLGSHGYEGHGGRIYNEQLRVALLFHATDGSLAPRRVQELVGHMDLVPTLAELCRFAWRPPQDGFFGRSLVPLLADDAAGFAERLVFAEQRRAEDAEAGDAGEMVAIQDRRHKLIRNPDGSEEFFALDRDPLELHDLGDSDARRAELRAALEERLELFTRLSAGKLEEPAPEFQDELEALGYAR